MKKKFLSVVLSVAMAATLLVGCGSTGDSSSDTQTPAAEESTDTAAEESTDTAAEGTDATDASAEKGADPADYKVVMVVKQSDSWFDDMATGIEQLKKDTGLNVSVLVPTIEKAREAGIVVVTHEAPGIADSVDLDVEAFVNETFGELFAEKLATAMGGKGKYAGFVGGLTMETHMAWYDAAVSYLKANYPDMENVAEEPYEDGNSVEGAHDKALEVLKAYPDIAGFFDCSAQGGGICEALQENDLGGTVKVVSLALPSMSATYLKDGSMANGLCWRPADAGYAACYAAYLIASGQGVADGTDLKATGYESISLDGNVGYGNAPLEFTADNIDDYNF